MKKVLFLGLGHLGKFFVGQNQHHQIMGTKRLADPNSKCPVIPYTLGEKWIGPTDFDTAIISFPPIEEYSKKLEDLIQEWDPHMQVIFISSTSLFGPGLINEMSSKNGQSRNAAELIKCEELIKQLKRYLIVRPGGLIDEQRHPKNFFKKTSSITKSKTNVNLVHTYDVASFLHFVLNHDISNHDFNLTCDEHPTKEEFYSRFNNDLSFDSQESEQRIISNQKSKDTGFLYKYNKLNWL